MAVSCRWREWSSDCCVLDHTRTSPDHNRVPTAMRAGRERVCSGDDRPVPPGPEPAATPCSRRSGGTLATVSTDPKDRWHELGSFIREQRGSARLSLRRLSELAGISNPYLSQIERGLRRPSAEILQQIAKALRIS